MLEKLKKAIRKNGLVNVTHALGYRSLNTVNNWIKKGKIPTIAEHKVKKYLAE